jgi:hypothetical protein
LDSRRPHGRSCMRAQKSQARQRGCRCHRHRLQEKWATGCLVSVRSHRLQGSKLDVSVRANFRDFE